MEKILCKEIAEEIKKYYKSTTKGVFDAFIDSITEEEEKESEDLGILESVTVSKEELLKKYPKKEEPKKINPFLDNINSTDSVEVTIEKINDAINAINGIRGYKRCARK